MGLAVESKRPDAVRFFHEVGMRPVRQYGEYLKAFRMENIYARMDQ